MCTSYDRHDERCRGLLARRPPSDSAVCIRRYGRHRDDLGRRDEERKPTTAFVFSYLNISATRLVVVVVVAGVRAAAVVAFRPYVHVRTHIVKIVTELEPVLGTFADKKYICVCSALNRRRRTEKPAESRVVYVV